MKTMSRAGFNAAMEHGKQLPTFSTQAEAEEFFFKLRDKIVSDLIKWSEKKIVLDFSVDSLLRLEEWYFKEGNIENEVLAIGCAFYFGEVVVKNRPQAKWVVKEFAFKSGRYEIGVEQELLTMMLFSFRSKLENPRNKKHDSLWRTYQCYFEENPKVTITF
jgi:hypothetical protein